MPVRQTLAKTIPNGEIEIGQLFNWMHPTRPELPSLILLNLQQPKSFKMAAINLSLVARDSFAQLAKRSDWPRENAGVMVVFCVVFVVAVGLIALLIYKKMLARREKRQSTV
ncbi:hypothetical protein F5144DRAFT_597389 [Chaetomium tenue]|uniref:Uncharacterized protein n=1 Tax=Chaetomium tenue TaxID=1854479 RepID=A0ACB7PM75_9PEZI|nr:hypothetical protein F5144DRAFT_597389 [Chaetomium globosum]